MTRLLSAGVLALAVGACDFGPSPSETVELLVEAVRARDSVEVARFIDIRRVSEAAVEPLIQAAGIMGQRDPDEFRRQTGGLGVEMLEQFRPMIAPLMEQLVWQMLLDPESLVQGPLGMLLGDQPLPFEAIGSAYRGVIDERREDNEAIVAVELSDDNSTRPPVVLELRLERVVGDWQVVGVENLSAAVAEALRDSNL